MLVARHCWLYCPVDANIFWCNYLLISKKQIDRIRHTVVNLPNGSEIWIDRLERYLQFEPNLFQELLKILVERNEIGQLFDCEISNYYRLFWDIRSRVAEERTFFLSRLKTKLLEKMDSIVSSLSTRLNSQI